MPAYHLEFINRQSALERAAEDLFTKPAFSVDLETLEWWNRKREKIALIQFAYRISGEIKVIIIDTLSECDVATALRPPLESKETVKVIHNAAFDAVKLLDHYRIKTAPIFDTMLAARQSGEKKYSLQSQAAARLNFHLSKSSQRSDWSRRPLDIKQIDYAARDAFAALLLYENQKKRDLAGNYLVIRKKTRAINQLPLPLNDALDEETFPTFPDLPGEIRQNAQLWERNRRVFFI
jgi:ribonuclease D